MTFTQYNADELAAERALEWWQAMPESVEISFCTMDDIAFDEHGNILGDIGFSLDNRDKWLLRLDGNNGILYEKRDCNPSRSRAIVTVSNDSKRYRNRMIAKREKRSNQPLHSPQECYRMAEVEIEKLTNQIERTEKMAITMTLTETMFKAAFSDMGRGDQFSNAGLSALYNYLDQMSDDSGENIELDVIALCCDYSEVSETNLITEYGYMISGEYDLDDEDALQECIDDILSILEDETMVITVDDYRLESPSYIVQAFQSHYIALTSP